MKKLLMAMVLMPLMVLADMETVDGITWTYKVKDGNAQIGTGSISSAIPSATVGAITIPSTLGGCPVTSIGDYAFCHCSKLTSVKIPSSVTSIGGYAFTDCSRLTSVAIPSSVTNIGGYAFSGTPFLENQSNGLVVLGGGVLYAYKGTCPSSVTIPSNVMSIGDMAFYGCSGLKSVTIPSSVTNIGNNAFFCCSGLTAVTIPSSVTSVGYRAFSSCGIASVSISEGVTIIGKEAFWGCGKLTSVTIPTSVTSIGDMAFENCSQIESVKISDLSAWCRIVFNYAASNPLCYGAKLILNDEEVTDLLIPNDVASIGSCAFYNCTSLKSVMIPSGVTRIGRSAFSGCKGLAEVTIPSSVMNIDMETFSGCSSLVSVAIPSSVTNIGYCAFYNCSGLMSVTIPSSVMGIGARAFYGCSGLGDGVIIVDDCVLLVNGICPTSIILPFGVRLIAGGAFYKCSGLTSVTMPESVTSIGDSAFYGCSGLTAVTIPPSVTRIGGSAFYACGELDIVYVAKGDAERIKGLYEWPLAVSFIEMVDVAFDLSNRGARHSGGELCQRLIVGETADAPVVCPVEGWRFVGWDGDVTQPIVSNTTFNAVYEPIVYAIGYENTKGVINPNPMTHTVTNEIVFAALSDTDEYWFRGWEPAKIEVGTTGDLVVTAKWDRIQGVAEAVGDQSREWASSDDADWFVTWNDAKGRYVVRSGEIGNNQTSVLETVVANAGTVSFSVATSCEETYRGKIRTDGMSFLVDGQEVLWLDGESGWSNVLFSISGDGAHRLQWKYGKDAEGKRGDDCVYLADFTFYHEVVVRFADGGAPEGNVPEPILSYNGAEITLPELGTLRNPRHAFCGWSDGEKIYQPGERFLLGDVAPVFTAQWEGKRLAVPVISVAASYATETTRVTISADAVATIRYTLDGSQPTETSAVYADPFEVAGSMTIKAAAFRNDWFDSAVAVATTVRLPWTYGECLNNEDLTFVSEGVGAWVRDLSVAHDGVAALRSGEIGNNATSRLELVIQGGGELSFWWKASTEVYRSYPMDYGMLVIDGEDVVSVYGEQDWERKSVALQNGTSHTVRWEFRKDGEDDPAAIGDDCVWLDEVKWMPAGPFVVGDAGATVMGDSESGFVIWPSEGNTAVEVTIPQGVDAAKVTVEVSPKVASVKPNGAKVKVVVGDNDITDYLAIPESDGVLNFAAATVKEEIVKETLDPAKEAVLELNAANPQLITAPTRKGLTYTLYEGHRLESLSKGDSKLGDGNPWKPTITVSGGDAAFYSIGVSK